MDSQEQVQTVSIYLYTFALNSNTNFGVQLAQLERKMNTMIGKLDSLLVEKCSESGFQLTTSTWLEGAKIAYAKCGFVITHAHFAPLFSKEISMAKLRYGITLT